MSAEILRRAASLMRERAEAASREPAYLNDRWVYDGGPDGDGIVWADTQVMGDPVAASSFPQVADHIASWHPAVALAVAAWLVSVAVDIDKRDNPRRVGGNFVALRVPDEHAALAVARAYLGEPA